jgi:hypothetical protein
VIDFLSELTIRDRVKIGLVVFLGLSIIFSDGVYDFSPQRDGVVVIKSNKLTGSMQWCVINSECGPYDR